ncbi:uncharacterized protein LOC123662131 [Melitaea cinxia]|uniref:uncharacterized protein LOC123662131 n=1 Tax=Melitaea cinxia TaxID=113334 RepID=UPI001E2702BC|nr:uncharacterized protein LOC123662131 [Melitaea cinxia]
MENSHVLENFTTKERSTNFSKAEVDKLQSLVGKYKHILLCKKTDGTSSKQKENVWNNISKEFNAVGETPRSEASSKRQSMLKTGGGRLTPSLPPSQDDEETTDWLKSIMSTSIDGNDAIYDDDVIKPHEDENIKLDIITIKNSNTPIAKVAESKTAEPAGIDAEIVFDTSTPHSSLKRPMSSPLKCKIILSFSTFG